MPPRKRTESKQTPPPSPITTTSPDHHPLRHTGPSIGTRARSSTAPSKHPSMPAHQDTTRESSETKDTRERKPTVITPFSTLLFCVLLLFAWYLYGMMTLLERLKDEVGWWSIVAGNAGAETWRGPGEARRGDLQGSLDALAHALGISPVQVAYAVKPLVPQASLTNIASKVDESGGSEAVRILIEDTTSSDTGWKEEAAEGTVI